MSPLEEKAWLIFPDEESKKARKLYTLIQRRSVSLKEVAKFVGIEKEFKKYQKEFRNRFRFEIRGQSLEAAKFIHSFRVRCLRELAEQHGNVSIWEDLDLYPISETQLSIGFVGD